LISTGVGEALREFGDRINQSQKICIEISYFNMDEKMSQVQEISLYCISQEWINNIIKYSVAIKIDLQITKDHKEITLLIEDNGIGFDKEILTSGKGNGWKNIISRANLINNVVELDTTPFIRGSTLILNAPTVSQSQDKKSNQITV
jgi:two-component system, NarL family, sensor kinase